MKSHALQDVRRGQGVAMTFARWLLGPFLGCAALPSYAQQVPTSDGAVSGTILDNAGQAWLGIPFAAPPVGDLRWRPPQRARRWTGILAATRFAPSCMQPLRDHGIAYYVGDDPIAEDCLYLNVWAPPGASRTGRLPVIVYIYGGSFVAGSSRKPLYVGDRLAAKGAIVVGFNYRLGTLGFLAHPALTAESPAHASGNYGLLDQVAALKWVKANIAAFGGDPGRVTIMGQSAGSMSISLLQTSPLARGLFSRIIGLSGSVYTSAGTDRVPTRAEAEALGVVMQKALGATDLAGMRRLPPDRIVALQGPTASPVIDGLFLTESPSITFASRRQADVPMLIGTVADETLSPVSSARTLAEYRSALTVQYGPNARAVEALYPATDDVSARAAARHLGHDAGFATMMRNWARLQSVNGNAPVYAYLFDRKHPYEAGAVFSDLDPATTGVNHTDDVPYWLGTFDSMNAVRPTRAWTLLDRSLGDAMQTAIVAFAARGDPNGNGLGTTWPRYRPAAENMLVFGETTRVITWPNADRMDALARVK